MRLQETTRRTPLISKYPSTPAGNMCIVLLADNALKVSGRSAKTSPLLPVILQHLTKSFSRCFQPLLNEISSLRPGTAAGNVVTPSLLVHLAFRRCPAHPILDCVSSRLPDTRASQRCLQCFCYAEGPSKSRVPYDHILWRCVPDCSRYCSLLLVQDAPSSAVRQRSLLAVPKLLDVQIPGVYTQGAWQTSPAVGRASTDNLGQQPSHMPWSATIFCPCPRICHGLSRPFRLLQTDD